MTKASEIDSDTKKARATLKNIEKQMVKVSEGALDYDAQQKLSQKLIRAYDNAPRWIWERLPVTQSETWTRVRAAVETGEDKRRAREKQEYLDFCAADDARRKTQTNAQGGYDHELALMRNGIIR